jgi:hypothetical protein
MLFTRGFELQLFNFLEHTHLRSGSRDRDYVAR